VNYEIVEMVEFSGRQARVYSIIEDDSEVTLFEQFIEENEAKFKDEIDDIISRLYQIGRNVGARHSYFKHNEGKPGDGVCALYDNPDRKLRLYCIRFGMDILILGGGGEKRVRAWQEDLILSKSAKKMIHYAQDIQKKIDSGDIEF